MHHILVYTYDVRICVFCIAYQLETVASNRRHGVTDQQPGVTDQWPSVTEQKPGDIDQQSDSTNKHPGIADQQTDVPSITNQFSVVDNQQNDVADQQPSYTEGMN